MIFYVLPHIPLLFIMNKIVKGRYVLKEYIARGGMGEVWLCFDIVMKVNWAIKIIKNLTMNTVIKGEYLKEVEILKHINHPSIPKVKDYIVELPYHYIVMEYIDGITLYHKVEKEGKQEENHVLNWGLELCDILLYLHSMSPSPIIYKDLKPDNIILDKNERLKLVDFGISCYQTSSECFIGPFLGTPGYASPEQIRLGILDTRSDIYNFGTTLLFLLTGNTYSGCFPNHELQHISKPLCDCLKRCLMHRPSKRYQTMDELKKELYNIIYYHNKKRICVSVIAIVAFLSSILFVFSYIGVEVYSTLKKKERFESAMQNHDYQAAIKYQDSNVEPYLLYYVQCIQTFANSDYQEAIKYAIQQVELLDTSKIENPDRLFYQIAQDCLFINTIEYYEKSFDYFSKITHADNKVKKDVQVYLNVPSLLKNYFTLNEDEVLELNNQLYDIYKLAEEEVDSNKKLAHYFILLEILKSRSNDLEHIIYKQIVEIIHTIRSLWNEDDFKAIINNKFFENRLILYEILAYYYLGVYEKSQSNDMLAIQNFNNMHRVFEEYQKKDERNENIFIKVALSYLYKFEMEQKYHYLQYAKTYYEKVLDMNAYNEVAKKGLEYITLVQEMEN